MAAWLAVIAVKLIEHGQLQRSRDPVRHEQHPRVGLPERVEAPFCGQRTGVTEGGDRDVHEALVERAQRVVVQPQLLDGRFAVIGDEDVRRSSELAENGATSGMLEV